MARKRQTEKMSTQDAIAIATGKKTLDQVQGTETPDFVLDDDSLDAATKPKKNRARASKPATTTKTQPPAAPLPAALPQPTGDNNIYIYNEESINIDGTINPDMKGIGNENAIDIKDRLTLKELKFLEIYLTGGVTIDQAMIQAGYGEFTQQWRYELARRIIVKYERQAGDTRNIFRAIGFGELTVAQGIKKLGEESRSETVKMRAHELATKCLSMVQDAPQGNTGIQIVFTCSKDSPNQDPAKAGITINLAPQKD